MKPKVRARDIWRTKASPVKSTSQCVPVSSIAGWSNSISKRVLKPKYGSSRAILSPSVTCTDCLMRMKRRNASCSTTPAVVIKYTKLVALPSMMGISGALTSTITLSTPKPAKADIKCSIVKTRAAKLLGLAKVVAMRVSITYSGAVVMSKFASTSMRRNTTPVLTGAGRRTSLTLRPECKPIPVV